ncbi:MAG: flagellar hook-length control protein FliK [Proteobacteria bacterium]|nr:flagellar hook-length control protein FliK [Pseudomonadota bacterium]
MAITPLHPTPALHPPSPPASIPPVEAVGRPRQEALDNAQRREALLSAGLETASADGDIVTRSGALAKISTAPLALALGANSPEDAANATKAFLSVAGRLIDQLLRLAQKENLPVSVQGKQPILTSPPAHGDSRQTAMALKDTLDQSGLFYESHIGEWAGNERSLASLMKEPQALLSTLPAATAASGTPMPAHPATALGNFDSSMAQIVSQQLNVFEQNRIVWQGEIWPGQPMDWEVSEDTPGSRHDGQEGEGAPQAVWRSDLRFELPSLGSVAAKIYWSGGHTQVQVQVADERSASSLKAHGAQLADALGSAGGTLDALQVLVDAGGCQST